MAPVTVAGAVAGAAAYGAFKAIADGDSAAFGAVGIGSLARKAEPRPRVFASFEKNCNAVGLTFNF